MSDTKVQKYSKKNWPTIPFSKTLGSLFVRIENFMIYIFCIAYKRKLKKPSQMAHVLRQGPSRRRPFDTWYSVHTFCLCQKNRHNFWWDENLLMLVLILYICFCSAYLKSENAALYLILPCNTKEITKNKSICGVWSYQSGWFFLFCQIWYGKILTVALAKFLPCAMGYFFASWTTSGNAYLLAYLNCSRVSWDPGIKVLVYCTKKAN